MSLTEPVNVDAGNGPGPMPPRVPVSAFARLKARSLLGGILALFLACTLVINMLHAWRHARVVGVVMSLAIALPIVVVARDAGLRWRQLVGGRPTRDELRLTLVVVPVILATYAGVLLVYVPLSYVAPHFVERMILRQYALFDVHTVGQWMLAMLVGAVLAPLLEEMLFRGLLLTRWAYRWGTMAGVVASSVLFALGHGEWPGKLLFGVAMSLLYLRTGKLRVNIAAHALNNFALMAPLLWNVLRPSHDPPETLASLRAGLPMALPLTLATVATFWLYRRYVWGDVSVRALLRGTVPYARVTSNE